MDFDSAYFGPQILTAEDRASRPATFQELRQAVRANCYYLTWGTPGDPPLPVYDVTLGRGLRGIWAARRRRRWPFRAAASRTLESFADLRWGGPSRRGFRRLIHPNGIALLGEWKIQPEAQTDYTGYFAAGSHGLVVARYSTCCAQTKSGQRRSLALVGKIFPTLDPNARPEQPPAHFITQEDIGGEDTRSINDADLRNAPNVTPSRRGFGLPFFLLTTAVLLRADRHPEKRQLYEIAELGVPPHEATRCPQFMRLTVSEDQPREEKAGLDFRDEILAHLYEPGTGRRKENGRLVFNIEVSDTGNSHGLLNVRQEVTQWERIGQLVFTEAYASYNSDFVLHFHHPPWRDPALLNRPATIVAG